MSCGGPEDHRGLSSCVAAAALLPAQAVAGIKVRSVWLSYMPLCSLHFEMEHGGAGEEPEAGILHGGGSCIVPLLGQGGASAGYATAGHLEFPLTANGV